MNINLLITFLIGMTILAATPGPGVFGSMAKAAAEGFKMSLFFIGGLVLGDIVFLALALLGLSAIAKMLEGMFIFIRIAGGLYLIYLGIRMFRNSQISANVKTDQKENKWHTCISGLLLTLGNPKPILFYASVLPTIINFDEVRFTDALMMMALIALVSFSVLGTYSYIASLSHKIQMSGKMQKRINQVAGFVMLAVGIFVMIH
ncbi:MAG: LysE family translocator [Bacteroidota bacterium]|jgi:threonine/homoserine/homoserine lactone efflux protein